MSVRLSQILLAGASLLIPEWAIAAVKQYNLVIAEQTVNITGKPVQRITVNGQFPAPLLEFEEGDEAVIMVHNQLKNQDSALHWHGLLLPAVMDGVPGFNQFDGIKPGQSFKYEFKVRQNGTYWYHAHSKGQEQDGLYGSFVIYPKNNIPIAAHEKVDKDYVVMLSDFHESKSDQIMSNLKKSGDYYQNHRETIFDVFKQIKQQGLKVTWQDRAMWNQMRMLKTDLSDVTGYTFLINGKTPRQNWTASFKLGEKIRLRFINASAMSFFDVRIPHLKMTVVGADGQPVKPVNIDEFRIGTAETYDVIVEPTQASYQIEAESIDRTGFAIGTLHDQTTSAPGSITMPTPRPRSLLTMEDMGMHHDMDSMPDMNHDQHTMAGMDHQTEAASAMQHDHAASTTAHDTEQVASGWANASTPAGHKALQYSDLLSLVPQKDTRPPVQELEIRLGGNMERYIWTINGKKFNEAEPLQVKYGERIRLKFINDSMMAHPMHLHGMFVQLENGQAPVNMPNKHTVVVPPAKTVTALLTADEPGEWAIHCHLLYHMSAGMMNKLIVAQVDETADLPRSPVAGQKVGQTHAHH
ncbi:copper resistance system multicopper oxidase [Alkanindiges sp. WGS2144]|uniref:copper resistance system multicopper oxidase n=1 Tax=Alkanindiges sp. WGS2144 TaxID=3366808 RepID=UPI0037507870